MANLLQDLQYGVRLAARAPGFTLLAVLTLSLGIGTATALFSVVHAVLLRPLPYVEPDRLVVIRAAGPDGTLQPVLSGAEISDLRAASSLFVQVGGIVAVDGNLTSAAGDMEMEQVPAANATDDFLPMLGVRPALGRLLDERIDTSSDRLLSVVISHELWRRRYGGDPSLLGARLDVNNMPLTVVGILPPDFRVFIGPDANVPSRIDLWFSAGLDTDRRFRAHTAVARLAPGVTLDQARAELTAIAARLTSAHPDAYGRAPLRLSADRLQDNVARPARPALLALMGAVGFVLLIACANVANLLLARTTGRSRELAVRSAIGAPRGRLLRQLVTEGAVLGLAGGAAGVLLAMWGETVLLWMRPPMLPPVEVNALDGLPMTFALVVTLLATIAFSLAPAIEGMRAEPGRLLKSGGRSNVSANNRLRMTLVVVEVALSAVLLVGAGLMLRTLIALHSVDTGFDSTGVLTLQTSIRPRDFREFEKKWQFYSTAIERLRGLSGVQSVSAVRPLPLEGVTFANIFLGENSAREITASSHTTLPGYFRTMGIQLREGRDFETSDIRQQMPVVIVDEAFARRMWPDGRALGRTLKMRRGARAVDLGVVIGIVSHARTTGLAQHDSTQVYLPYHANALFDMAVVVKTEGDPMAFAAAAKKTIESLGGQRPVHDVRPMASYVSDGLAESRFLLLLLGIFAGLASALCAIGLYGVVSQATLQRTRETGIRLALGATRGDILRLILREGLGLAVIGTAIGTAAAMATSRVLQSALFGVSSNDVATLAAVAVFMTGISAAASYVPARRAARMDVSRILAVE